MFLVLCRDRKRLNGRESGGGVTTEMIIMVSVGGGEGAAWGRESGVVVVVVVVVVAVGSRVLILPHGGDGRLGRGGSIPVH